MYWTRKDLKRRAREVLSKKYVITFVMCLALFLAKEVVLVKIPTNILSNFLETVSVEMRNAKTENTRIENYTIETNNVEEEKIPSVSFFKKIADTVNILLIIILSTLSLLYVIFIGQPIVAGVHRFLLSTAEEEDVGFECLSFGFFKENYYNIIKTFLLRGLVIAIGFLLFVIPGIIAVYAYSMVPYILADNPTMNCKEVLKLSRKMTMGHKLNIYILNLSFIPLVLLASIIPFSLGTYLLFPYTKSTEAQLYVELRRGLIESDPSLAEDFNLVIHYL